MADMRSSAESLAKAMPERFEFHSYQHGTWVLEDKTTGFSGCQLISNSNANGDWAFWGPLADEFECTWVDVWDHRCDGPGGHIERRHDSLLESIAEAVCQEAERRVEKKQG